MMTYEVFCAEGVLAHMAKPRSHYIDGSLHVAQICSCKNVFRISKRNIFCAIIYMM